MESLYIVAVALDSRFTSVTARKKAAAVVLIATCAAMLNQRKSRVFPSGRPQLANLVCPRVTCETSIRDLWKQYNFFFFARKQREP